jgi:O-antigen/teichoic acid export membrane protein
MSEMTRAVAAATASLRMAAATIVAALLASVYLIVAARLLGPERFSNVAVCMSLSYVGLLFLGPLNLTLMRFSSAYRSADDAAQIRPLLRRSFRLYAPWVAAGIGMAIMFARPIARVLNVASTPVVPFTGILIALGIALGAARATALGLGEHRLYSGSVLLDTAVRVAAGGTLIAIFGTAGSALAGFVVGSAAALVVLGTRTWRLLPVSERPWSGAAEVQRFMAWALAFSAIVAGLQNVDMIAAKIRLDSADAGHYSVALAVTRSFLLLAAPFAAVALAGARSTTPPMGLWARVVHAPAAAYLGMSIPPLTLLLVAPAFTLRLLFGSPAPEQVQPLRILALAFVCAGAFLVLAHGEMRAGRFGFFLPVGISLALELLLLAAIPATPNSLAWTALGAHGAALGFVLVGSRLLGRIRGFKNSSSYWNERYARGGASGAGSQGKFAEFKAEVLNGFVARHGVRSIIEFGCGDGQQLALAAYPNYLGFDVSDEAVGLCRQRFSRDDSKAFRAVRDYTGERADLTLSLDVVFHLVEDDVFEDYMERLFDGSMRWVIVYSSNHDSLSRTEGAHVRHRQFTRWVLDQRPHWVLRETIPNRYPFTGDFRLGSFSDFFIFERA